MAQWKVKFQILTSRACKPFLCPKLTRFGTDQFINPVVAVIQVECVATRKEVLDQMEVVYLP